MSEAAVTKRPATYQDVVDAPPHMVAQIVDGALHLHPRPASRHALAASALQTKIGASFGFGDGGPGGWWIVFEPELHLSDDVLVPDLAGWRRERMPAFPDVIAFDLAPDWVCEVLSPSTRALDLTRKRDIYALQGVAHLWLVDPDARTLEAFALDAGRWVLLASVADEGSVSLPPFDAVAFELAALWP